MSRTKNNHIVPRSYLASWAGFNREDKIRYRDLESHDPVKVVQKHSKAICYERFYYPQEVEDFLQVEIETPASRLWPVLFDSELNGTARDIIARFIAYQAVRSVESIDKLHTLSTLGSGRENVIFPLEVVEKMDPVVALGQMRDCIDQVAEALVQRNWTVLDFGGNWCIETSDSPVCLGHDEENLIGGFLPEEILIFPLSPNRVLRIDQARFFGYKRQEMLPGMARSLNDLVRNWAKRFIILPPR